MDPRLVLLCIRDGWGIAAAGRGNAVSATPTPVLSRLLERFPHSVLDPCGEAVGLPSGQMGNSEVGHMNLGAGRVVYQDLTRINRSIEDESFFRLRPLRDICGRQPLHIVGLLSDGGVHSHQNHLEAILRLCKELQNDQVFVHAILDGRDTSPTSGAGYLERLLSFLREEGVGRLATVSGRYYTMDRDRRWDRVEKAWRALCLGEGVVATDAVSAVRRSYDEGTTDEFLLPLVLRGEDGRPVGPIRSDHALFFFNFRADRMRQIVGALTQDLFSGFERSQDPTHAATCMTSYEASLGLPVVFGPQAFEDILPEVVANMGWKQLRAAETEKFAHVTYFTSCGREQPFAGEERILVPSPRVATYDLQPEMSAPEVTVRLVDAIRSRRFSLIVANYANADMVGHTGMMPACRKAVSCVDTLLGKVLDALFSVEGRALITADHGNIEKLLDREGNPHTAHTTNPVHLIWCDEKARGRKLRSGRLCDVAPTILDLFGLPQPAAMTGDSLLGDLTEARST